MIPPALRRNFSEIYRKMPLSELQSRVQGFNFSLYLEPLLPRELSADENVVIYALPYFQKLVSLVESTDARYVPRLSFLAKYSISLRTVANYVLWRFIRHRINNLDRRFEAAQHGLYRMLYGREETPERSRFCVSYVNGNLGNVVGAMFVRKHFDQQSKKDVNEGNDLALFSTFI